MLAKGQKPLKSETRTSTVMRKGKVAFIYWVPGLNKLFHSIHLTTRGGTHHYSQFINEQVRLTVAADRLNWNHDLVQCHYQGSEFLFSGPMCRIKGTALRQWFQELGDHDRRFSTWLRLLPVWPHQVPLVLSLGTYNNYTYYK